MSDFKFEIETTHTRFPSEAILDNLRAFAAARNNTPFSMDDFNTWPTRLCRGNTIAARFGSWRKALEAAGLNPNRPPKYSDEQLFEILESLWRELRRRPTDHDLRARRHSRQPYSARWGSLKNACILLARHKNGELSRDQLLSSRLSPERAPRPLRLETRFHILTRDHYRCTLCGASPATDPAITLEVDHIHPLSRGGTNDPANLRTLCRNCNAGKGAA